MAKRYFYVYQNKTYFEEKVGNLLWSPKLASGDRKNAGYETMKEVCPGDIIFHSFQGEIVAISVAKSKCYDSPRPSAAFNVWDNIGWKIDTEYFVLSNALKVAPYIPELYYLQPANGPYTSTYRGKQQYLCNANDKIFEFLFPKILEGLASEKEQAALIGFLSEDVWVEELPTKNNLVQSVSVEQIKKEILIEQVEHGCIVYATVMKSGSLARFEINLKKFPQQKVIIGKKVGDIFNFDNFKLMYRIDKIIKIS